MPHTAFQIHFPVRPDEKQRAERRGKPPVDVKATSSRETASPRIAVLAAKARHCLGEWGRVRMHSQLSEFRILKLDPKDPICKQEMALSRLGVWQQQETVQKSEARSKRVH